MHDPARMGVLEGPGHLTADAQHLAHLQAVVLRLAQARFEIAPRHVLTHDRDLAVFFQYVEECDDVGMVSEAPECLSLPSNAQPSRLVEAVGLDKCQRHISLELRIARQVDPFLRPLANQMLDLVAVRERAEVAESSRRRGRRVCLVSIVEALTAGVAESMATGILALAGRTGPDCRQRLAALSAEVRLVRVRVMAAGAVRHPCMMPKVGRYER